MVQAASYSVLLCVLICDIRAEATVHCNLKWWGEPHIVTCVEYSHFDTDLKKSFP